MNAGLTIGSGVCALDTTGFRVSSVGAGGGGQQVANTSATAARDVRNPVADEPNHGEEGHTGRFAYCWAWPKAACGSNRSAGLPRPVEQPAFPAPGDDPAGRSQTKSE